jgi:prefoldin subunit 5
MSGQGIGPEHAADDPDTSTADAIARSRDFLEKKLLPDLEDATSLVSHLEASRDGYTRLQKELRTTLQEQQSQCSKTSVMAHLGQGVHIPVDIEADSLILVSFGLKENPEVWSSDAGLYMQLDRPAAITFAEKKIDILTR